MIPPRSVLAAVDFSEPSRVALGCAARLAGHSGAELHVLHAEDPLLATAARSRGVDLAAETLEELERFVAGAAPAIEGTPRYHVVVGRGVDVVCDIADRERVDVIVMGARGMSGAEYAIFGSTTEGVLVRSNVSVLAVPASWTPPRAESADLSGTGPMVAALECTTPALAAAAAACRLAKMLDTTVAAVHVVPPIRVLERWRGHAAAAEGDRVETARAELAAVLPQLRSEVPVELSVESGDVATELAAAARRSGSHPFIVLGRRPPGSRRGAPAAIASRVLGLAGVPVLVYLPDE